MDVVDESGWSSGGRRHPRNMMEGALRLARRTGEGGTAMYGVHTGGWLLPSTAPPPRRTHHLGKIIQRLAASTSIEPSWIDCPLLTLVAFNLFLFPQQTRADLLRRPPHLLSAPCLSSPCPLCSADPCRASNRSWHINPRAATSPQLDLVLSSI